MFPDDGKSIPRNVGSLNLLAHGVTVFLYYSRFISLNYLPQVRSLHFIEIWSEFAPPRKTATRFSL